MSWAKSIRSSFWLKPALAMGLAAMADVCFWPGHIGSAFGAFALAIALAAIVVRPAIWSDRRAVIAIVLALAFAAALAEHPTLLGWCLFWTALAVAGLAARVAPRRDALAWAERLLLSGVAGLLSPISDLFKLLRRRRRGHGSGRRSWLAYAPQLVLPLIGAVVFATLFVVANPVIDDAIFNTDLGEPDARRICFWLFVLLIAWMALRPRFTRWRRAPARPRPLERPGVTVLSVGLSLALFNLMFAVQNGLDIAFLWSGAPLPGHVTMADYAHRGAYTLILTAILAGAFVLFALRPHSTTGRSPALRIMVVVWVAQNLLLVASSILRTLNYVQSYGMTELRIAALVWMALVAAGLVLICWRLLRGHSSSWLVNANVAALGLVLAACTVVDFGAVAAAWNVRHAAETGGHGVPLDIAYLKRLGSASAVPLSELVRRPLPATFRAEVEAARAEVVGRLRQEQSDWRTWTWRGQRRLDCAERLRPPGGLKIVAAYDPYPVRG